MWFEKPETFQGSLRQRRLGEGRAAGQISAKYNPQLGENLKISETEAAAVLKDRKALSTKDVDFKYHDLGPGGKTDPYTGMNMGKTARKDRTSCLTTR